MRNIKKILTYILAIVSAIILFFGFYILIQHIQKSIFTPDKYILWMFKSPYNKGVFIFEIYIIMLIMSRIDKKHGNIMSGLREKTKGFRLLFILGNIALLYAIIINVTVITEEGIIDYSILNPSGKTYEFEDIKKVNTGFYESNKKNERRKGGFYYYLEFNDGKKIDMYGDLGGTCDDAEFYGEMEKVDKILMDRNIEKEASLDNIEYNDLGTIYIESLRRIVSNNP